jgi:hypothetical protein
MSGAAGGFSRAHPMCNPVPPTPPYPEDVGDACGAGSNLALCLASSTDSSCTSGLCLWHSADPAGVRGYCTAACTLGDPTTCPAGFACMAESCDDVPVCVRTSGSTEPVLKIETYATNLDTYVKTGLGLDGAGAPYWGDSSGAIYRWDGMAMNALAGMTVGGRVFDAVNVNGVIYLDPNGNEEQLGVIQDGQLTVTSLATITYARGFFATQGGTVYYLEAFGTSGARRFLPIDDTLMPLADEDLVIDVSDAVPKPVDVHALRSYGFFGQCTQSDMTSVDCFSADGRTVEVAPGADARQSVDPTALWGVLNDTPTAAKWNGESWIAETELEARNPDIVAVFPLRGATPDRVLAFAATTFEGSEAYYLNGTCWEPLHDPPNVDIGFDPNYGPATLLQLDERSVAWIEGASLKIVRVDSFSNF